MVSLTENEARTIEFLIRNFSKDYNLNQLARELHLSPGGIFKILKKLEKQNFLLDRRLGNNIFYKINYDSQDALDVCKFALTERKITPYIKVLIRDLDRLRKKTKMAILFGSVLNKEKEAKDIDILLVFNKKNLKEVENLINELDKISTKKIHAIYQTEYDLIENIKKQDNAILDEIKKGIILWGRETLVEAIKNGQN